MGFANKAYVALQGLATPGYNGRKGMISADKANENGRWPVTLESGEQVTIKEENLKLIDIDQMTKARADGSWKTPLSAPGTHKIDKYYGTDPDGYEAMRKKAARSGDIKSTNFDHGLYKAMAGSMNELGNISTLSWEEKIWPEVADGSLGKHQLTCNERWTLRFGLGEFDWDFDARFKLLLDLPTKLDVMSVTSPPTTVKDHKEVMQLLKGPSLKELGERPSKKAKTDGGSNEDRLVWVDGMLLDKEMLIAAREAVEDDDIIDALEAVKIFNAIADDGTFTRCERWTLRYILSAYVLTDAAFHFLKEACFKMKQNDDLSA